jgi:hypothetical protein
VTCAAGYSNSGTSCTLCLAGRFNPGGTTVSSCTSCRKCAVFVFNDACARSRRHDPCARCVRCVCGLCSISAKGTFAATSGSGSCTSCVAGTVPCEGSCCVKRPAPQTCRRVCVRLSRALRPEYRIHELRHLHVRTVLASGRVGVHRVPCR